MKTYLVGGAVRDELLGFPVQDKDFVVVGSTPEEMVAAGFRPDRFQIVKIGYELDHRSLGEYPFAKTLALQIVTSVHPLSLAWN